MMRRLFVLMVTLGLLLSACGAGQPVEPTLDVDTIVQATFQALTAQAPQATPTVVSETGSISGALSYPSEGIPPLLVVAFRVDSDEYYWVQTAQNQSAYQMDGLKLGTYHVVAYALPDGKLAGRYDQFYLCGLHQGCTDSNWVDVQVQAGVVTPNVDPGNWYIGAENYPSMPAYDPQQQSGSGIAAPVVVQSGSIAGQLSYPSSFIPSMVVVAFESNGSNYRYVITNQNSTTYQIDDLPPGSYYVVAYPVDSPTYPGGYSQAVPCGLLVDCADHSLIPVNVIDGQVTQGVNPGDFYAPPGTFPVYPLP
jgi:hypothetical protein